METVASTASSEPRIASVESQMRSYQSAGARRPPRLVTVHESESVAPVTAVAETAAAVTARSGAASVTAAARALLVSLVSPCMRAESVTTIHCQSPRTKPAGITTSRVTV